MVFLGMKVLVVNGTLRVPFLEVGFLKSMEKLRFLVNYPF